MIKFGRKFFFDKVYTKKNYTIPIIIGGILIVAIISTFAITRYYKNDKPKEKEVKVALTKEIYKEVYSEIPDIKEYFEKIENIEYSDFELIYPEEFKTIEDTTTCEDPENTEECKKILISSIGDYIVTIKSEKTEESTVTLKVIDSTKPVLELKEVTITEGDTYSVTDFINSCSDNSKLECTYEYYKEENENYENIVEPGEHIIKIIAKDTSGNASEVLETKLIINKKKVVTNNQTTKPKTCEYGNLKHSNSYVLALKVDGDCAISAADANSITNTTAIKFNKILAKEIQKKYLQKTIEAMNLSGDMTYDITYGPVFNTTNKGVVGYFLMSEARQTIDGKTTTIARYFVDENGNRVWKINSLNLK